MRAAVLLCLLWLLSSCCVGQQQLPTPAPSPLPSLVPTQPTNAPFVAFDEPRFFPTSKPSPSPTQPSSLPTVRPSISLSPTESFAPSQPTKEPTWQPTFSYQNWKQFRPTRDPTLAPTYYYVPCNSGCPVNLCDTLKCDPSFQTCGNQCYCGTSPCAFNPTARPTLFPTSSTFAVNIPPTPTPTSTPTPRPSTLVPSPRPTRRTNRPTRAPTSSRPTHSPTFRPTTAAPINPTFSPTPSTYVAPISRPTPAPTPTAALTLSQSSGGSSDSGGVSAGGIAGVALGCGVILTICALLAIRMSSTVNKAEDDAIQERKLDPYKMYMETAAAAATDSSPKGNGRGKGKGKDGTPYSSSCEPSAYGGEEYKYTSGADQYQYGHAEIEMQAEAMTDESYYANGHGGFRRQGQEADNSLPLPPPPSRNSEFEHFDVFTGKNGSTKPTFVPYVSAGGGTSGVVAYSKRSSVARAMRSPLDNNGRRGSSTHHQQMQQPSNKWQG